MRHAEPVGVRVGAGELRIVHEHGQRAQVATLGLRPPRARRTRATPTAQLDDRRTAPAREQAWEGPRDERRRAITHASEAPEHDAKQIPVEDRGAGGRVRDLEQHPRVPVAEAPGRADAPARVGIVHLLVDECVEVAPAVVLHEPAGRTPALRAYVEQTEESEKLVRHTPPRRVGRVKKDPYRVAAGRGHQPRALAGRFRANPIAVRRLCLLSSALRAGQASALGHPISIGSSTNTVYVRGRPRSASFGSTYMIDVRPWISRGRIATRTKLVASSFAASARTGSRPLSNQALPGVTFRAGASPTVTSSEPAIKQRMPPPRCRCGSATPPGAKSTRPARIRYSPCGSRTIACRSSTCVPPPATPSGARAPRASS